MPKANGWVKIHRKILETELTASQFKFFVGAILLAKTLNSPSPGLVDLSVRQLADELRMSRSEVWRREKELEEMEMLTIIKKGFTINNYKYYQTGKGVPPTGQSEKEPRDTGVTCWVCGKHEILPPIKDYTAWQAARFQEHHIIPKPEGGNEPSNKIQLCQLCHKQAHHNQLSVKRDLSVVDQKKLEFLQSKTVPYKGQILDEDVPPEGLNVPPTGLNVPPTGRSVPSRTSESDNKNSKNNKKEKNQELLNKFNIFWAAYPKKAAKADAEKAFTKINPGEGLFKIILGAIEMARKSEGWVKEKGKFIPYPATWLNGKRWEDEITVIETGVRSKFNDGWK